MTSITRELHAFQYGAYRRGSLAHRSLVQSLAESRILVILINNTNRNRDGAAKMVASVRMAILYMTRKCMYKYTETGKL